MPINVKGLFETLQYKANNIDSSTSTAEIFDTLKAIKLADGNTIISYDSDGALPTASTSNVKLAYVKNTGIIKFNNGTWDTLTGSLEGTASAGAAAAEFYQGTAYGYSMGAFASPPNTNVNTIEKFSFTADGNSADVGDLTQGSRDGMGSHSSTDGFHTGGFPTATDKIEKFSLTSDGNATQVGTLSQDAYRGSGITGETEGYIAAYYQSGQPLVTSNRIEKFPYAITSGNITDVGDIHTTLTDTTGNNSTTHGYVSGGTPDISNSINVIQKFPFAAGGNATDVGDMTVTNRSMMSSNSNTSGYSAGGKTPSVTNIIDKFPFSTDANSTDVGDLTVGRYSSSGNSSTTHGYATAGYTGSAYSNVIDKYSFSTDENATDVGDTLASYFGNVGNVQV